MPVDYDAFAEAVVDALSSIADIPAATESRLRRQIDYFHAHYQWEQRVAAWASFISSLKEN